MPWIRFPSHQPTAPIWSLRHNFGASDACFIALAESLDVPLITCDEKQSVTRGHEARVEAYGA